jgi:hypothetical protein
VFEAPQVLARVEKLGDLYEPVLKLKQTLPKLGDLLGSGALQEKQRNTIAAQASARAEEMARKAERRGPPPATSTAVAPSASRKATTRAAKKSGAGAGRRRKSVT